jgi:hypothetical protein
VNGTKIADIDLPTDNQSIEFGVRKTQQADEVKYIWQYNGGEMRSQGSLVQGGLPPKGTAKPENDRLDYLGRYPGKWDCMMRLKGKQIRQLLFTVNAKGGVDADPAQAGPPTFDNVAPIELRFGKDILDVRVRPDAMKKSRGFGLPWPKPPATKFPPASGLPDPK